MSLHSGKDSAKRGSSRLVASGMEMSKPTPVDGIAKDYQFKPHADKLSEEHKAISCDSKSLSDTGDEGLEKI